MKIIDLSWELHTGLSVYPGDPEVSIERIQTIENHEWNMSRIKINSHDWTHVNVPIHSKIGWKTLDDYRIDDFIWPARLYESELDINSQEWLVFHSQDITQEIAEKVVKIKPLFIALPSKFEFDIKIERYLLEHDIISFERLENTEKLPKQFMFYGVPLKLREWDGSPVRAYAIVEE